ncbi:MAG: putative RNA methyltransferase [Oscillospiraceae bacterium]
MSLLKCPVCGDILVNNKKSYVCSKGHSFDISSKGYVNLLLSGQMNAKLPGDNKMMVNARADFLSKGYYSHLADEVSRAVSDSFSGGAVLDAGCGEGYYTENIYNALSGLNFPFDMVGIDISKFACARAARRFAHNDNCEIAAASIFHLPLEDNSCECVVTMFAPFCREEFFRVLKSGGRLVMAIPAEDHLINLKSAVYDEPYKNHTSDYAVEGFDFLGSRRVSREIFIDNTDDIRSLFSMTPYYYKTGREGHERLEQLTTLRDMADFEVLVYRKKNNGKDR